MHSAIVQVERNNKDSNNVGVISDAPALNILVQSVKPADYVPAINPARKIISDATAGTLDPDPAAVYLSRLGSLSSKPSMTGKLDSIAREVGYPYALSCPWHSIRYQHTAAFRAQLQQKYKPSTANCMLTALGGVLKAAWQPGLIPVEEYHRAVALKPVKGYSLHAGAWSRRACSFVSTPAAITCKRRELPRTVIDCRLAPFPDS